MSNYGKRLIVEPGSKIRLKHFDPGYHSKHESHKSALPEIQENLQRMEVNFKQPTKEELAHDFLWRVHPHVPAKGSVAIFNRSHYGDVLVARVHDLVPERPGQNVTIK